MSVPTHGLAMLNGIGTCSSHRWGVPHLMGLISGFWPCAFRGTSLFNKTLSFEGFGSQVGGAPFPGLDFYVSAVNDHWRPHIVGAHAWAGHARRHWYLFVLTAHQISNFGDCIAHPRSAFSVPCGCWTAVAVHKCGLRGRALKRHSF